MENAPMKPPPWFVFRTCNADDNTVTAELELMIRKPIKLVSPITRG